MMDYENKYHTLKTQHALLSNMKDVHSFFLKNNIKYSLCGGTLIGAVREGGFIPWDDDIDIMLDRSNFIKFLQLKDHLAGYSVARELWIYRIKKIDVEDDVNPTIDVFVIDNVPNNFFVYHIKLLLLMMLQGMLKHEIVKKNVPLFYKFCSIITFYFGKLFSDDLKYRMYDMVSQIGNKDMANYSGCFNDLFEYLRVKFDNNIMENCSMRVFEDTMFSTTDCFDNYLRTLYGDYMTPVEESRRIPAHIISG